MTSSYKTSSPRWKRSEPSPARNRRSRQHAMRELPVDKLMLAIVLGLTLFGVVMVYSASAVLAQKNYDNQFYFLARQATWAVVGIAAMAVAMRIDYRNYKQPGVVLALLGVTLLLLVAALFSPEINGTRRWIRFGGLLSLQPSELSKITLIVFLAFFLEKREAEIDQFKRTFAPVVILAFTVIGLVALEPDLGTSLALGLVLTVMLFQAGVPLRNLAMLAVPVAPALVYMLMVPWRFQRILAFLDPWKYQSTWGFQAVQSMIAIGTGGMSGMGFAQGKQKLFYLPAPHTDFIFAVIGEELGLVGAGTLVLVFAALAWRGFKTAGSAPDAFGQLLATGLTVMITAQAFFNMSVALSLVPTKGIPLPFISSGGSSLAISLFAAGVLLNVSKHGRVEGGSSPRSR